MRTFNQDEVNQGAMIIGFLVKAIIEIETRPRNEEDDFLMDAAFAWVEEHSDSVEIIEAAEH
jgi:hypothetical protein|tara:strand:+ start:952 stop:1137 length:186 start_codon:yes stop_codon:yes gene_type:complete